MDMKLLIRVLEWLEETYDKSYSIKRLTQEKLNIPIDGEFSKIIKYLKTTNKIEILPEDLEGSYSKHKELYPKNIIKITPDGIDFLTNIKLQETQTEILNQQKRFTSVLAIATIIIGIGTLSYALFYFINMGETNEFISIFVPLGLGALIGFLVAMSRELIKEVRN